MAHEFESGFTVREPAWHGLSTVLDEYPDNWDAARMAAGLMWEPKLVPAYRQALDPDTGDITYVQAPAQFVERDDTGALLGTVSDQFELLTHAEMGPIVEAILGDKACKYETAGSVRHGKMVYVVVRLDEPYQVAGDIDPLGDAIHTYPFLVILNSHDGTGACKVLFTQIRVVCMNTVQAADADGNKSGLQFTFRHTAGMKARIEEAKSAMGLARVEATRWQEMAAELHAITISDEQRLTFLDEFMPMPPAGATTERVRQNVERDRLKFQALLDSMTNVAQAGTGLQLVNAAVEYLDHVRGFQNKETYFGRQLLRAEPLKAKAVKIVRDLATAAAS